MEKIASFTINHDTLQKGLYVSRVDGDAVTYDLRMKLPNQGDFLSTGEAHTIEHLLATFLRNAPVKDQVIYVGPMGCRTGFYLIFRDSVPKDEAIREIREGLRFVADFEGEIPGAKKEECGNYLDHDLEGAKRVAKEMCGVLRNWTEKDLKYPV
jgi:S-ribosylhomocysteine lyase